VEGVSAKLSYSPDWQKLCQLIEFQFCIDVKKRDGTISSEFMVKPTELNIGKVAQSE
jgi:hypothetical protein